ncbi:hypothetical protein BIW11_12668 [Tropilaelaps mercedesae]|uniref:Protein aurora borealis n=1 Tax=Tropilaelaps mercedesae TaxID=418985 RepID=A0A1V9X5C7_9ACAR|nr:hypothetical protein BIW11_12668 [Tropilaelaps mercedesae]
MRDENSVTTPKCNVERIHDLPLSSTMCHSSTVYLNAILHSSAGDSGVLAAEKSFPHSEANRRVVHRATPTVHKKNVCKVETKHRDAKHNDRSPNGHKNAHSNRAQQTPRSRNCFFTYGRNQGQSTPKRNMSLCPFATPDRLNEYFIPHEVFEVGSQMCVLDNKDVFSPCIEYQSTMNPTFFDTSDPAAYLPPTRTISDEEAIQRVIAEFFRDKVIVPSPSSAEGGNRMRCYLSLGSGKLPDATLSSKHLPLSACGPKLGSARNAASQTSITISPNVDLNELFAPFATYVETSPRISITDASVNSGSPSSDSICSVSRRKLFFEEDDGPVLEQGTSFPTNVEQGQGYKESVAVLQQNNNFNDTIELSLPPRITRTGCSIVTNSFTLTSPNVESSRVIYQGDDGSPISCLAGEDADEIPRGDFNIDLSPIKPINTVATQKICHGNALQVNTARIELPDNVSMTASVPPTRLSSKRFLQEDGCTIAMDQLEDPDPTSEGGAMDVTNIVSMEMSII